MRLDPRMLRQRQRQLVQYASDRLGGRGPRKRSFSAEPLYAASGYERLTESLV